jgi:hypothetical protein
MNNKDKFELLKSFNLPTSQYAITGSGPLGIRDLREIKDIDILVTDELWEQLVKQYGSVTIDGEGQVVFGDGMITAIHEGSFSNSEKYPEAPPISKRINDSETISGLPFEALEYVIYFKSKNAREKDLQDLALIITWLKNQQ